MIIQGDMLSRQEESKYITIFRDPDIDQSLHIYVKLRYALNWSKSEIADKDFSKLLLNWFDCDIEQPIKRIPDFVKWKLEQ